MTPREENQFVKDTLPLIHSIINKMNISGAGREDAVQVACMAAVEALRTYDKSCETALATWIHNKVSWRLKNWLTKETLARSGYSFELQTGGQGNEATDWAPTESDSESEPSCSYDLDTDISVRQAVKDLSPVLKEVAAGAIDGESQTETGERLGVSRFTVIRRFKDLRTAISQHQSN